MKKFNINEYMYIQITDEGWQHLEKTVGIDYINACIKAPHYTHSINGETWYRLQCWSCFGLMPPNFGGRPLFNTNVMFDDEVLKEPCEQPPSTPAISAQAKQTTSVCPPSVIPDF